MKSGLLGKKALTKDTNHKLYTVTAGAVSTMTISVSNRVNGPAIVSIDIGTTDNPTADDNVYTGEIAGYGGFDRTGMSASAGEFVTVRANTDFVTVRVHGFEEAA